MESPDVGTRSSRDAIKTELAGKLVFDDPRVFQRLGLGETPAGLVDACVASFQQEPTIHNAKRELEEIVSNASKKSEPDLEAEIEQAGTGATGGGTKSKARERKMYKPLSTIMEHIELFDYPGVPRQFQRQWVSTGSSTLTKEGDTWGFPKISPDFALLEITQDYPRHSTFDSKGPLPYLWRCRSAFAEIKPTAAQGPVPADKSTVKAIVTQAADYARLHISTRPFQLFSIGLLIFGSRFCVAIFDRDGVLFSPVHDMWNDSPTFVRVIRRLTCAMSPVDLGQDPTVRVLSDTDAAPWQERAKSLDLHPPAPRHPVYAVTMGKGNLCWYTLGLPIWSSFSLLGRGTVVWRVCDAANPDKLLVLKNSWRSSRRLPESTIYESIKGKHPGVADYEFGGDVVFPEDPERLLSVKNLRGRSFDSESSTAVLHRLIVSTFGRPLWEFKTELELLKGIRAALKGHQFLSEQGILHRDISAGNVLLGTKDEPGEGYGGFVMDIEFAHHARSSIDIEEETVTIVDPIRGRGGIMSDPTKRIHKKFSTVSVQRGAVMTGTIQFMAYDVLSAMRLKTHITHEVKHDLESFVWVLCYSFGRRFLSAGITKLDQARRTLLRDFFHTHFGRAKLEAITLSRASYEGPLSITRFFPELFSQPIVKLFHLLSQRVIQSFIMRDSEPLTYDFLFGVLNEAIEDASIEGFVIS